MTPRNMRQPTLRFFKGLTQERSNSSAPNVYLIELSRAKNGVFSLYVIKNDYYVVVEILKFIEVTVTSRIPYKDPYVVKSQLVEQNEPFLINEIACIGNFPENPMNRIFRGVISDP